MGSIGSDKKGADDASTVTVQSLKEADSTAQQLLEGHVLLLPDAISQTQFHGFLQFIQGVDFRGRRALDYDADKYMSQGQHHRK